MSVSLHAESECAVIDFGGKPDSLPLLHIAKARNNKDGDTNEPKANQSRCRRPTPYSVDVERFRHEGVSDPAPDSHLGSADAPVYSPRGRSTSQLSTFTPRGRRAPTPHPRTRRKKGEKTVHWAEPVEQTPERRKDSTTTSRMGMSSTQRQPTSEVEEEEQVKASSEPSSSSPDSHSTRQIEVVIAPQAIQICTLHRDRRSSLPRPKSRVPKTKATTSKPDNVNRPQVAPKQPLSSLVPAPLRLPDRQRSRIALSASAPAVKVSPRSTLNARDWLTNSLTTMTLEQGRPNSIQRLLI